MFIKRVWLTESGKASFELGSAITLSPTRSLSLEAFFDSRTALNPCGISDRKDLWRREIDLLTARAVPPSFPDLAALARATPRTVPGRRPERESSPSPCC